MYTCCKLLLDANDAIAQWLSVLPPSICQHDSFCLTCLAASLKLTAGTYLTFLGHCLQAAMTVFPCVVRFARALIRAINDSFNSAVGFSEHTFHAQCQLLATAFSTVKDGMRVLLDAQHPPRSVRPDLQHQHRLMSSTKAQHWIGTMFNVSSCCSDHILICMAMTHHAAQRILPRSVRIVEKH